ncbi:hypothetical protein CDAR_116551 [Caerostris darwini]|uniref:Uncharacterized protein n=1 Tax=Caerostris darwini TaxID=1538125 RepID=A0AAV4MLC8_9ARAC|nr:hypothetical protein CDAR_116551 [Caerostris darwini]
MQMTISAVLRYATDSVGIYRVGNIIIIIGYHKCGQSLRDISSDLEYPKSTVAYVEVEEKNRSPAHRDINFITTNLNGVQSAESGLLPISRRHFRHQILTTPSTSSRRGIPFSFGLHHSNVFSSPLNVTVTLNYWVKVANFNSVPKMASRSEDVQLWRCPVEYRTSFGKGNVHQRMHVVEHYASVMV